MIFDILPINEIRPYENNPRINDNAVNAVVKSIRQCGYIAPIIIDENHVILAGHTRLKALKAMDVEEAQVLICDSLSEEQKKKFRFLDNKIGEKSEWDFVKLLDELHGLDLEGFDFFGTGNTPDPSQTCDDPREITSGKEIETEAFDDEEFKYQCPKCGFRFN